MADRRGFGRPCHLECTAMKAPSRRRVWTSWGARGQDDPVIGTAEVPSIGRAHHRATVAAAFAEPGHIVLVCGEAGVGKSSLVAAERAGAATEVIEGSCLQLAGHSLPLAALEQIFYARGGWPEAPDDSGHQSPEQRLKAVRQWA